MRSSNFSLPNNAVLETLEQRQMFTAVSAVDGVLSLKGLADQGNSIQVRITDHGSKLQAIANGESVRYKIGSITAIKILGGNKADSILIDADVAVPVRVESFGGGDTIVTGSGNDTIHAGSGDDKVYAGSGDDVVDGQAGDDTLNGGEGNDIVGGGGGDDLIRGEFGDDRLAAGEGSSRLLGGPNNDTLIGGSFDYLNGEEGRDIKIRNNRVIKPAAAPAGSVARPASVGAAIDAPGAVASSTNTPATSGAVKLASFTLIDADTDRPVAAYETLASGTTLDLAKLPQHLSIRANLANGGGQVRFDYNGQTSYRVENAAPYAIAGDDKGDFNAWTPQQGQNTLVGNVIKNGKVTSSQTLSFVVVNTAKAADPSTSGSTGAGSATGSTSAGGLASGTNTATNAAPVAKIAAITKSVQAGQGIHVHGLNSTLKNGAAHEATYDWNFGESGSAFNALRGFNAAHVYAKPGSYTITLKVTDKAGKTSTTTQKVTVSAAVRKVIYVSKNGKDTNAGTSTSSPVKTIDRAFELVGDNTEIRFNRGETFNLTAGQTVRGNNVVIGAWGTGKKPVLKWTGDRTRATLITVDKAASDVAIQDLSFDTKFTQDTDHTDVPFALRPTGTNITVRNNEFLNVGYAINCNGKPTGLLVQDNTAPLETGVRDYFVWGAGTDVVVLHNKVANSTREHIVRVSEVSRILVAYNDLTNMNRQAQGDKYDTSKGAIVIQRGDYAYVAHNDVHGPLGAGPLGDADGMQDPTSRFDYAVFEQNNVLDNSTMYINHGASHVTIRGNVFHNSDKEAIRIEEWNDAYQRGVSDVTIDHNTAFNDGTKGSFLILNGTSEKITLTNNLYVAPNLQPGAYGTSAVRVGTNDLTAFNQISGNVWPSGDSGLSYAEGGVNYVGSTMIKSGYQSPTEWLGYSQVKGDAFQNVNLPSDQYSLFINGHTVGSNLAA